MSTETPTTEHTIKVPDNAEGTHIVTQYGCRFPDGHYDWVSFTGVGGAQYAYERLVDGPMFSLETDKQWRWRLEKRAADASIQVSEYLEQHTLVKRQMILVTTAPEDVKPG